MATINVAVETTTHEASGSDAVRSRPTRIGDFRVKGRNRLAAVDGFPPRRMLSTVELTSSAKKPYKMHVF